MGNCCRTDKLFGRVLRIVLTAVADEAVIVDFAVAGVTQMTAADDGCEPFLRPPWNAV